MDTIFTRRSIRDYTDQPIEKDKIDLILKAGMYAPTGRNRQPWFFLVVTDRELLKKVPEIQPFTQMSPTAACAILVCAKPEISPKMYLQDCSAATENILLEAHYLGIGAVWCAVYPDFTKEFSEMFKLPSDVMPISYICIGYPDTSKHLPTPHGRRFDETKIHYNTWQE